MNFNNLVTSPTKSNEDPRRCVALLIAINQLHLVNYFIGICSFPFHSQIGHVCCALRELFCWARPPFCFYRTREEIEPLQHGRGVPYYGNHQSALQQWHRCHRAPRYYAPWNSLGLKSTLLQSPSPRSGRRPKTFTSTVPLKCTYKYPWLDIRSVFHGTQGFTLLESTLCAP